jgi:hypothetical protein
VFPLPHGDTVEEEAEEDEDEEEEEEEPPSSLTGLSAFTWVSPSNACSKSVPNFNQEALPRRTSSAIPKLLPPPLLSP